MSIDVDMQPNLVKQRAEEAATAAGASKVALFPWFAGDAVNTALTLISDGGWTTEPVTTERTAMESDLIDARAAVLGSFVAQDEVCVQAAQAEPEEVDANDPDVGWKASSSRIDMKVTNRSYASAYGGGY